MKRILVIGSGGREHAICKQFKKSPQTEVIFALPGNAGIAQIAQNISDIKADEHDKIIQFCQDEKIDFVFVGPEQPLVEGIVDRLQEAGIRVFGSSKKASQLEGSKIFMKRVVSDNNVPTARYESFTNADQANAYAKSLGFPCVIKTDGLAAGKGVIIAQSLEDAQHEINEIFSGKFGDAGQKIIIEEFLDGYEASYFVICDGKNFVPLGFAHDHKRVGEGETGLNTGGMGTFAPSPLVDEDLEKKIIETIIKPSLLGMKNEGAEFVGVLFAGIMVCNGQPKLLEFNIRFGDPETQVILPRVESDFVDLIELAIDKKLDQVKVEFNTEKKLVCVVMCAKGYPKSYKKGTVIKGLEALDTISGVEVFHAGTSLKDGNIVANGGRVLNIVASGNSFKEARQKAYEAVDMIDWEDGFVRSDIALKVENV